MANYTITPGNVTRDDAGAVARAVTWGETISAGDAVFLDTDKLYKKIDAKVQNKPARDEEVAIALSSGNSGQSGTIAPAGAIVDIGTGSGMVAADVVIADGVTPGQLKPAGDIASGEYLVEIGRAIEARKIQVDPTVSKTLRP